MDFFKKNKTALIALGIVIIGTIVYFTVFQNSPTPQNSGSALVTFENSDTLATNHQFLSLFTELQDIQFDTSILQNPYFLSLGNYTQPITPVTRGRENPFAPF